MHNYKKVIDLSNKLIAGVEVRDGLLMQQKMDALERAYKEEFGNSLGNYDAFRAFVLMNLAGAKYFAYNNMFTLAHARYDEVAGRMEGFLSSNDFSDEQKAEIKSIFDEIILVR